MTLDLEAETAQADQPARRAEHAQPAHAEIGEDLRAEAELAPRRRGLLVRRAAPTSGARSVRRGLVAGEHDDDAAALVGDAAQRGGDR